MSAVVVVVVEEKGKGAFGREHGSEVHWRWVPLMEEKNGGEICWKSWIPV